MATNKDDNEDNKCNKCNDDNNNDEESSSNHRSIDELVEVKSNFVKEKVVDTIGSVTYSLMVGSGLDYFAGLSLSGIIASRVSATVVNTGTGALYGMWRDYVFTKTNTNAECGRVRKSVVELVAFNMFQVPIYAVGVAIGSLISEGEINWTKVREGSEYLVMISPLIGPTMGWYMDVVRRVCGVKSAAEKVEKRSVEDRIDDKMNNGRIGEDDYEHRNGK